MDKMQPVNYSVGIITEGSADVIVGSILMVVVNLTAIVSNALVVTTIVRSPQLRNSLTNVFVINLCTVDLFGSLLVLPMSAASFIINGWSFGEDICVGHAFLTSFFSFASILSLSVISVERFYSIKRPMHYAVHVTPCRVYSVIVLIWIQSLLFASLSLLSFGDISGVEKTKFCTYTWHFGHSSDVYLAIVFTFCYVFPGLSLLAMYIGVFKVARAASLRIQPFPDQSSINISRRVNEVANAHDFPSQSNSSNAVVVSQETARKKGIGKLKAAKTLMLLFGMYLVLWGPYYTLNLCGALYNVQHIPNLELGFLWVGFSSFVANPFLYGWMNRSIREELLKFYYSLKCKSRDRVSHGGPDEEFMGSKEDFLQFLERTTCSTRITTQTCPSTRLVIEPASPKDGLEPISDMSEHHV